MFYFSSVACPLQVPSRHLRRYRLHPVFQHQLQLVCQRQFQRGTANTTNNSIQGKDDLFALFPICNRRIENLGLCSLILLLSVLH